MSKRKSFEDLLKVEIRWPKKGDKPFVAAVTPFDNANIADDGFARLVFMMDGYRKAADLMVAESASDRSTRDILVFPIIFNYRQFLELALKHQLSTYGPAVGIRPNWRAISLTSCGVSSWRCLSTTERKTLTRPTL